MDPGNCFQFLDSQVLITATTMVCRIVQHKGLLATLSSNFAEFAIVTICRPCRGILFILLQLISDQLYCHIMPSIAIP